MTDYAYLQKLQLKPLENTDCLSQFQSTYEWFHCVETAFCSEQQSGSTTKSESNCIDRLRFDLKIASDNVEDKPLLCY